MTESLEDVQGGVDFGRSIVDEARAGWQSPPEPPPVAGANSRQAPPDQPSVTAIDLGPDGAGAASTGLAVAAVAIGIRRAVKKIRRWFRLEDIGYDG
jgi:hypothetical protein